MKAARSLLIRRPHGRLAVGIALLHHRVVPTAGDRRYELVPALGEREFAERVELLVEKYRLVPASQLLEAAASRRRREPVPVALTFDDDLDSHGQVVAPILQRAGIPATFFVGPPLAAGETYWWEDLQRVADRGAPSTLTTAPELDLAPVANGAEWAIHAVAGAIERLPPDARDAVAQELHGLAGPSSAPRLEPDVIASLSRDGLEFGFHTRGHYLLTALDDERLARELRDGRDVLADIVGGHVSTVAYPHGKADARVARAARTAGYSRGFTNRKTRVDATTDPLLIGRIEVHGTSLADFEKQLATTVATGPQ
jgi:peptidoglycan/xylan/chitin deacetylase (PgdA/CDA1 family)